jgi:hypothetical protein
LLRGDLWLLFLLRAFLPADTVYRLLEAT